MLEKFLKFLDEQGVTERFTNALREQTNQTLEEYVTNFDSSDFDELVIEAFTWEVEDPGNGFDFWNPIDDKWIDIVNNGEEDSIEEDVSSN